MNILEVLKGWGNILKGYPPFLSVEITRSCPLSCPGCYAYDPNHLSGEGSLSDMSDYRGEELIERMLDLVHRYKPCHLSIVGGEPMLRFRELDTLLPIFGEMGIYVQLVTSGVRKIPNSWTAIRNLQVVVSIDGLKPEHDTRRAPATYERIQDNIAGSSIIVHCVITSQMANKTGSFDQFLHHWSSLPEVNEIWFSFFTPQKGAELEEILTPLDKGEVLRELGRLRSVYPKLYLPDEVIEGYLDPPRFPTECMFARTTLSFSADLSTTISPCQFGGNPDCTQCGCMATAGLKAVGDHRLLGILPLNSIFRFSEKIGYRAKQKREEQVPVVQGVKIR